MRLIIIQFSAIQLISHLKFGSSKYRLFQVGLAPKYPAFHLKRFPLSTVYAAPQASCKDIGIHPPHSILTVQATGRTPFCPHCYNLHSGKNPTYSPALIRSAASFYSSSPPWRFPLHNGGISSHIPFPGNPRVSPHSPQKHTGGHSSSGSG